MFLSQRIHRSLLKGDSNEITVKKTWEKLKNCWLISSDHPVATVLTGSLWAWHLQHSYGHCLSEPISTELSTVTGDFGHSHGPMPLGKHDQFSWTFWWISVLLILPVLSLKDIILQWFWSVCWPMSWKGIGITILGFCTCDALHDSRWSPKQFILETMGKVFPYCGVLWWYHHADDTQFYCTLPSNLKAVEFEDWFLSSEMGCTKVNKIK